MAKSCVQWTTRLINQGSIEMDTSGDTSWDTSREEKNRKTKRNMVQNNKRAS